VVPNQGEFVRGAGFVREAERRRVRGVWYRKDNVGIRRRAFTRELTTERASRPVYGTAEHGAVRSGEVHMLEDAAIDQAVEGIINGIFFNQGHVCCAGSRLLVQESVEEEVVEKLRARMEHLIVGDPLDKNTDIGAINSKAQCERIHDYLKVGQDEGAELFQTKCSVPEKGYWVRPSFFTKVAQSHRIVQEEIFGPVLSIQSFRTLDEALEKANNTPYGLSGGVWTDKGAKIFKVTRGIKAGVIWANTFNKFDPSSPFGGYKESGYGREGGRHGLRPYVELS
jgi:aldehyde dehydrogenase (NAD+)